jgi:hypothetical protein
LFCAMGHCGDSNFFCRYYGFKVWVLQALIVLNPGKGVCVDPVKRGAILEGEGPSPPSGDNERQLSSDRGGGET